MTILKLHVKVLFNDNLWFIVSRIWNYISTCVFFSIEMFEIISPPGNIQDNFGILYGAYIH